MVSLDPFDLVQRLGHIPVDPLVEALRRLHARGGGGAKELSDLLASYEKKPSGAAAGAAGPTRSPDYEAARRHFVRHSERLREQAILAERLLDRLAGPEEEEPRTPLQQTLRIQAAPGDTSGARFIVANARDRVAHVRFITGHVHGLTREESSSMRITFEPDQPRLDPGGELEVRVAVDVPAGLADREFLEFGVDVMSDEQRLLKLWVRVELREGRAR
jgi:hypothetical protein